MISTVKNEDGYVVAHVEWKTVDHSGLETKYGDYVWLQNLWIHPNYRSKGLLQEMIATILSKAPQAQYGYFTREKYGHRMSKLFKRSSVEAIVKGILV